MPKALHKKLKKAAKKKGLKGKSAKKYVHGTMTNLEKKTKKRLKKTFKGGGYGWGDWLKNLPRKWQSIG